MGDFTVGDSKFELPPPETYYVDLLFIEVVKSQRADRDDYYRWFWKLADVAGQEKWAKLGAMAFSQTSMTPTLQNRFGNFVNCLYGKLSVNQTGSTEDLIFGNYRVKAFLKHRKSKDPNYGDSCIIEQLIEGSSQKGAGCGVEGSYGKLRERVSNWLVAQGRPALPVINKEENSKNESVAESATNNVDQSSQSSPASSGGAVDFNW